MGISRWSTTFFLFFFFYMGLLLPRKSHLTIPQIRRPLHGYPSTTSSSSKQEATEAISPKHTKRMQPPTLGSSQDCCKSRISLEKWLEREGRGLIWLSFTSVPRKHSRVFWGVVPLDGHHGAVFPNWQALFIAQLGTQQTFLARTPLSQRALHLPSLSPASVRLRFVHATGWGCSGLTCDKVCSIER